MDFFARQASINRAELKRSCQSLLSICIGLVADNILDEAGLRFLRRWLDENAFAIHVWPGDVIASRIDAILGDGIVTADELDHLKKTLRELVGMSDLPDAAAAGVPTRLPITEVETITFAHSLFCVSGDFIYGPRRKVIECIVGRGGAVLNSIRKDLNYLVLGGRASLGWKYDCYGNKVEKAIAYQRAGHPILIVAEQCWARCLG